MTTEPGGTARDIPLDLLRPHPANSNHMPSTTLVKLQRHIERGGRYEPLVVRPHPAGDGSFEILNGHHRMRALKGLDAAVARCIVWDVDDDEARLYLATLNRLTGEEVPERRMALLEQLLGAFGTDELSTLLPEGHSQLEELSGLARSEAPVVSVTDLDVDRSAPVILDFAMERTMADTVDRALDEAQQDADVRVTRSEALLRLAQSYLERANASDVAGQAR